MKTDTRRLVLVGGGHAHLCSLKRADRLKALGFEVILISPSRFHYYSGMGPGLISHRYQPEQARVDVKDLVESRHGTFVQARVVGIDPLARALTLETHEELRYDIVSFNVGSHVRTRLLAGADGGVFPVKPIENLVNFRDATMAIGSPRIVVVGGGPAGVEIAGNTWQLLRARLRQAHITLLSAGSKLLSSFPDKASRLAEQSLRGRGVKVVTGFRVASLEGGVVRAVSGAELPYDLAVMATGVVPSGSFRESSLRVSDDGALLVNESLQYVDSPVIFGAGDCISIQGWPMHRVGVYAVRQGPVLFHNLCAWATGRPMRSFAMRRGYGLILNLGDDTGMFVQGRFVWQSRVALFLKDRIDMRFMRAYRTR